MITLHFAGYQPARSVHTRALHALRENVTRRVGRDLCIAVTDNILTTGHKAVDLLRMVETGKLDGCYFASSYLAGRVPRLAMFDRPFQAGGREHVWEQLDGSTGAAIASDLEAAIAFSVLGWWDNGIRHISNAVRPIRTPADCIGLRLRTLNNAQHQAAFRRLGFQPTFIDVADLPKAVAERTVDAQENPLTNMVNFGLHAYHRHVSLTGHLVGIAPLLINRARFQEVPCELRHAIAAAATQSVAVQRKLAIAEDAECRQVLRMAGVLLVDLDAADVESFRRVLNETNGLEGDDSRPFV
jgi:C4-dicarboxylate-binding protein DctP